MHRIFKPAALAAFLLCASHIAQAQSLFLSPSDIAARKQLAQQQPWAKASLDLLLKEADDFPSSYEKRFGTPDAAPPPEGGAWLHWYACPESGRPLQFRPPDQNICPDTGKNFTGYPYDHVVYQLRNDALAEAAVASALAYQFTKKSVYAQNAANILKDYARVYPKYTLHDINNKPGPNGGMAYAQTLDESIWLIKIAWTYDLIRDANVLTVAQQQSIEHDVLRASAAVVLKAHKEPTMNIQSWINAGAAAVGFTLNDQPLITEAIDGPIGFRYQMQHFVHEGFWAEGAWGYQFYAMRALTMTAQMASRKGMDLWKQEPNLLALFHSPLGVLLPDGSLPAFNDSGSPDLYGQSFLYEVAYAATRDPILLNVIEHGARGDREAFFFGAPQLPKAAAPRLTSAVFPEAGYATLRSSTSDLTAIMKFGPHGGGHGHYDKLNFVLFSHGITLAEDPGTHFYGLPIHKEWDAMTIAHNTISVDGQRQAQATGKLMDWHVGDGWTAVRADAGPVYTEASLQRTILLTSGYILIIDRCQSKDGKPHTFDWAYHNVGTETMTSSVEMKPYSFSTTNGYQRLLNVMHGETAADIGLRFVAERQPSAANGESNSTPATYDSAPRHPSTEIAHAQLTLQMLGAPATEVFTGSAPSRESGSVPFVIARRVGTSVTFATLLTTSGQTSSAGNPAAKLRTTADGGFQIETTQGTDSFSPESFKFLHTSR
ncbi:heparinase II/III family protein [Terriglobus sp. TAA 43]|uniref:heparinase II/III domain-containing protein n=1 Tax=Terriglobus sp. TAA 43 TaxID=278961 RepID=UPI00064837B6|nr:heparinase II/III family protein [Terriglobus sp. TAA 43]